MTGRVFQAQERPLARLLGTYLSGIFTDAGRSRGLEVTTSPSVGVSLSDDGRPTVGLADGTSVTADVLVSAVGDVPNLEWLSGTGLADDGVLAVDTRGRVREDIVAAGDVA